MGVFRPSSPLYIAYIGIYNIINNNFCISTFTNPHLTTLFNLDNNNNFYNYNNNNYNNIYIHICHLAICKKINIYHLVLAK